MNIGVGFIPFVVLFGVLAWCAGRFGWKFERTLIVLFGVSLGGTFVGQKLEGIAQDAVGAAMHGGTAFLSSLSQAVAR